MFKWSTALLVTPFLLFASFSSSPNYQLHNYYVGGGAATNNSSSSTYTLQGSLGEQTNNSTAGSTYTANNSSIQAEQLNVPPAPILTSPAGTYNQLNCVVNTGGNPSDTTFAIAISSDNFVTTNYVQASTGTIVSSPDYETYSTWNSSSGINITGLVANTTYYTKVAAKQGLFTNTKFGAVASTSTGSPTLSFSVSPSSTNLGSFLPQVITTSSSLSYTFATNGVSGGSIYVKGANNGLYSSSKSFTIPAVSGNLSSLSQGFGIQSTGTSQTSGGPLTSVSPYNGTGNTVGAESTTFAQMFTTSSSIVGGSANAVVKALAAGNTPSASDYSETFTFIASASF